MADGYARASGRAGVCMATSGPGATNLVTGLATAMLDTIPVVAITGQVSSKVLGSDAFQEVDITGITLPITKHNFLVTRAEDIAPTVRHAFQIATSGRPGPVLVDITKDAQQATAAFSFEAAAPRRRAPPPHARAPSSSAIREAIALIQAARNPSSSPATASSSPAPKPKSSPSPKLAGIPIATTLLGLGCHPRRAPALSSA